MNNFYDQINTDRFCHSVIEERKKQGFKANTEENFTPCIIEPQNDLGLLNLLCSEYSNIFWSRTFTYPCYVLWISDIEKRESFLQKENFVLLEFDYFISFSEKSIFQENNKKLSFKLKFFQQNEIEKYKDKIICLRKAKNWSEFLDTIKSPIEWAD